MINSNGTFSSTEEANFKYTNRGLLYGDAVFETIKVVNRKLLFWEDHYFRLMASMRILRMQIPGTFTPEYLEYQLKETIKASQLEDKPCRVRLTVYRDGEGKYLPETNNVAFFAFAKAIPSPFYIIDERPYEVELYNDHYLSADLLSTLKTTNKAIQILGSIYAKENNYDSCLVLNTSKNVVEGLSGNLFMVSGNTIKTPPLSEGCLRGIIRKQLLSFKALDDYELIEAPISPFELQKADELFLTNVITGIQPITKYRRKAYKNTVANALLKKLNIKARLG